MLVTFTSATGAPIFLACLYKEIAPGASVTTSRSRSQLDAEKVLKTYVSAGAIVLSFDLEAGDDAQLGVSGPPLLTYTNLTRPSAQQCSGVIGPFLIPDAVATYTPGSNPGIGYLVELRITYQNGGTQIGNNSPIFSRATIKALG